MKNEAIAKLEKELSAEKAEKEEMRNELTHTKKVLYLIFFIFLGTKRLH